MHKQDLDIANSSIDKDVLDIMKEEDVLECIKDDKEMKRFMLNCFCEFLSQIKILREKVDNLNKIISIISSDRLAEYFVNYKKLTDMKKEEKEKTPKKSEENAKKID